MASLTPTQLARATEYMFDAVQARHPHVGEAARAMLTSAAEHWTAAEVWEGDDYLVVLTSPLDARWGAPESHLHVLHESGASLDDLDSQRDEIRAALPESVSCRVPATRPDLLRFVRSLGLGVAKLGFGGAMSHMMTRLADLPSPSLDGLGVRCETVSTMEHVVASSALRRSYFLAHPEHGWASSTLTAAQQREIDARVEAELEQRLAANAGTDFVLIHDEQVIGAFGFTAPQQSPVVGVNSSFNICIAPDWHGRGLGMFAYRVMIEQAAACGVDYMHGATSNPGVLRIGKKLGRHVDNWLLRRDQPWMDVDAEGIPSPLKEFGAPRT